MRDLKLEKIKNRIVDNYQPEKIILFGSRARKNWHKDSDYDLLILKNTKKPSQYRIFDLMPYLPEDIGIDAIIYTPEEFQRGIKRNWSLIEEVLKEGKVVYEKI